MLFFESLIPLLLSSAGRASLLAVRFRCPLFLLPTFVLFCSATISACNLFFSGNSCATFLGE